MIYYLSNGIYFGRGRKNLTFSARLYPMRPKSSIYVGEIELNSRKFQLINVKISEDEILFTINFFDDQGTLREILLKLYKDYSKKNDKLWEGDMIDGSIQNRVRCNIYTE